MVLVVGARVQVNRFPDIAMSLQPRVDMVLRKTCADIIGAAMARTLRIDTGAMKAGYRSEKTEDLRYIVYNLMHYHIYHELGTIHISAMPMLVPALEMMRRPFSDAIVAILSRPPS
jgi:hypothetical protein